MISPSPTHNKSLNYDSLGVREVANKSSMMESEMK